MAASLHVTHLKHDIQVLLYCINTKSPSSHLLIYKTENTNEDWSFFSNGVGQSICLTVTFSTNALKLHQEILDFVILGKCKNSSQFDKGQAVLAGRLDDLSKMAEC